MKKVKLNRNTVITAIIILAVIIISAYYLYNKNSVTSGLTEAEAVCIGQNSQLYVQTGCPACQRQEELFGEFLGAINLTDCFLTQNRQICIDKQIEATPTWIVNGNKFVGVRTVQELKQLTGC